MLKYFLYIFISSLVLIIPTQSSELKISSNILEVDRIKKLSKFSGNVYAQNDEIEIWSDEMIISFNDNDDKINHLNAEKRVKIVKENFTVTGDKGVYYPDSDILTMLGNVEVFENENIIKCNELFMDIKNSVSIMSSDSVNRVEAYITNN
jgi:lipopolysaccharide transport protein LptA